MKSNHSTNRDNPTSRRYLGEFLLRTGRWLGIALAATAFGISGCAGTRSTDFQLSTVTSDATRPHTILVSVTGTQMKPSADPAEQQRVDKIAHALQAQLVTKLNGFETGIIALPDDANSPSAAYPSGTLLLRSTITDVVPGNAVLRIAVGFGAGRSTINAHSELLDLSDHTPLSLASWDSRSTTGSLPGPALGVAGAVQTANDAAIAAGAAGVAGSLLQTQKHEIDQSSTEIVLDVRSVFEARNWTDTSTPE